MDKKPLYEHFNSIDAVFQLTSVLKSGQAFLKPTKLLVRYVTIPSLKYPKLQLLTIKCQLIEMRISTSYLLLISSLKSEPYDF